MVDERDLPKPLSSEERRQAEFHRANEDKKQKIAERQAQIKAAHGEQLRQRVSDSGFDEDDIQKAAVDILARGMAEHKLDLEQVRTYQVEEAIGKAQAGLATENARKAELLAQQTLKEQAERDAEKSRQEQAEKQAREAQERDAQKLAARSEPIPGSVQRFDAAITEKKAQRNAADFDRLAEQSRNRPNYARHEELKRAQESSAANSGKALDKDAEQSAPRGEISEAKAERLAKLDNMYKSANERANSIQTGRDTGGRGGGGRGGR